MGCDECCLLPSLCQLSIKSDLLPHAATSSQASLNQLVAVDTSIELRDGQLFVSDHGSAMQRWLARTKAQVKGD